MATDMAAEGAWVRTRDVGNAHSRLRGVQRCPHCPRLGLSVKVASYVARTEACVIDGLGLQVGPCVFLSLGFSFSCSAESDGHAEQTCQATPDSLPSVSMQCIRLLSRRRRT